MLGRERELQRLLARMRKDWDARARKNALFHVNSAQPNWTDEEFFRTGEINVAEQVLNDMRNVCQGADTKKMRVLEIGCGAGRLTRSLANVFGEVHAVDISPEMIALARKKLAGVPNVFLYTNNGLDLAPLPDDTWFGLPFSPEDISALADECGFECRHRLGAGTQYFWIWFFKRNPGQYTHSPISPSGNR